MSIREDELIDDLQKEIAELTNKLAAAEAHIESLSKSAGCACDYDAPGEVCIYHKNMLAKERQAGRDEVLKEISDALQSDLEHGVKWLNEEAAEEFERKYPALNRVLRDSNQRSNDA